MKVFWSYAKLDNKKPHKITKLREIFSIILDETTGTSNSILIDEIDLRWGVQWQREIEEIIRSVDAMVSILTPSYFNSRSCINEFKLAVEHGVKVYPLYFRGTKNDNFQSSFKEVDNEENINLNKFSIEIEKCQYRDFRKYRNKDWHCEEVQDFLDKLANEIAQQ